MKMRIIKVGRNDPCPCGKKKEGGKPIKYKKCCELKDIKDRKHKVEISISRKDFIGSPYTECPQCKENTFGVFVDAHSARSYNKECTECSYAMNYKLPKIKKRVIYLDQFVFDNIVKSLDKTHPKNKTILKDPFWIDLYKKLEIVCRAQLVVFPDSFFHRDESAPTGYFDSVRRIYEHFSGGITFYNHDQILEQQICEHFESFLVNKAEITPQTLPENIVFGRELHEWHSRMRISVGGKPKEEQIEETQKSKKETYQRFLEVFNRWKTEKHKKFEDWYNEESEGFAKGTFLAIQNFATRRATLAERFLQTGEVDLNDVFPPSSLHLIESMQRVASKHGINDEPEVMRRIGSYLFSKNLDYIPSLRIGTLLYAALASQAANGRLNPPSEGVSTDVSMISSFMPYCEAIFVDNENANLLSDGRVKIRLGCNTKVFSLKSKEEFLIYLDDIVKKASPEHLQFVEQVYGKNWRIPYLTILDHKD